MKTLTINKTRIEYIDTVKGILIIFLIFHHIVNVAQSIIPTDHMQYITKIDILYTPYFMQTFFLITGLCSNFNKPFKEFIINNLKSLIIPLISFAIINQMVAHHILGRDFFFVHVLGVKFFFLVELYWFLTALFIAKIILYIINKTTANIKGQFILVFIAFLFATSLNNTPLHSYNFFHWHNAFSMLIFMWAGTVCRKKMFFNQYKNKLWIFGLLYLFGIITFILIGKQIPYYTHFPHYNWKYTLPFLFFASTGSIMIMYIGQNIPQLTKIKFLGQNSIVVYGIHFSILSITTLICNLLLPAPTNHTLGLIYYLTIGGGTLFFCYQSCKLFQNKYLKYLIGKF